jgi:hypothetical protein
MLAAPLLALPPVRLSAVSSNLSFLRAFDRPLLLILLERRQDIARPMPLSRANAHHYGQTKNRYVSAEPCEPPGTHSISLRHIAAAVQQ